MLLKFTVKERVLVLDILDDSDIGKKLEAAKPSSGSFEVDALRVGRAREKSIAAEELEKRIGPKKA